MYVLGNWLYAHVCVRVRVCADCCSTLTAPPKKEEKKKKKIHLMTCSISHLDVVLSVPAGNTRNT